MQAMDMIKEFLPSWMPLWVIPLAPVVVGFIAAFWGKIKALYAKASTYLISIVKVDADLSAEMMCHFGTTAETSKLGGQGYMVLSRFVRSKRKQMWILSKWIDKDGDMTFWVRWKKIKVPVWVSRGKDGTQMTFRFFRGTIPMLDLLKNAVHTVNTRKANRYRLHRIGGMGAAKGEGGQGRQASGSSAFTDKPATSFYLTEDPNDIGEPNHSGGPEDLWLPTELKGILDDARQWSRNREWYLDHRLPWRRGYLLHGKPGTGKTSIARAIGIDLDMPIYAIDLQSMTNNDLSAAFEQARSNTPCMVLFEDLDSVYNARTSKQPNAQLGTPPSFDLLLNQIQGVGSNDGVMVMMTTNHLETIDQALGGPAVQKPDGTIEVGELRPRPGRIDRMVKTPDTIDVTGRRQLANRMLTNETEIDMVLAETHGMTPAQFQEVLLTKAQERL